MSLGRSTRVLCLAANPADRRIGSGELLKADFVCGLFQFRRHVAARHEPSLKRQVALFVQQ